MADIIRTVMPSGGDYTSLSAWEAGQQKIIASGDSEQAECYAMADTTAVAIDGWTTAADAYIRIYTPASERHDGKWDTAKYRLEASVDVLSINEEHVRIEGLQIHQTSGATDFRRGIIVGAAGTWDLRVDNSLIRADGAVGNNCVGIMMGGGGAGSVLRTKNTAIYGFFSAGNFNALLFADNANVTVHAHNCVGANSNYGFRARNGGTINAKNCYVGATDYGDYLAEGTGVINRTTTASEDATGSAGLQSIAYSTTAGAYFTNIAVGSEDFHIGSASALVDAGTDLSADANYAFTDDIDGQTRSAPWDIGIDEVAGADTTLAGTTQGTASIAGVLSTSITPAASVSAAATTQASLGTSITLAAAVTLSIAAAAEAQTQITPAGSAAGAAAADGSLNTAIQAGAAAQGTAQTAAALTTEITLAAAATVSLAAAGALDGAALLAGAVTGAAAADGALNTSIQAAGAAQATAAGTASLTTAIMLAGAAPLTAQTQAAFEELVVPAAERTRAVIMPWRSRARVVEHAMRALVRNHNTYARVSNG